MEIKDTDLKNQVFCIMLLARGGDVVKQLRNLNRLPLGVTSSQQLAVKDGKFQSIFFPKELAD